MPARGTTTNTPPSTVNNSTPAGGQKPPVPELPTISPAPPLRRRPKLIAVGVALIALGGAVSAYIFTAGSNAVSVVAISDNVQRGQQITDADLTTANITPDPALHTVPSSQRASLVGKRAAVDLSAGSILTPADTTTALIPGPTLALVGVAVTAAQLPAQPLVAGDTVRVVDTPRKQDDPPSTAPDSIAATVVATRNAPELGQTVVDVTVPNAQAPILAARIATGRVAIVLDSGQR